MSHVFISYNQANADFAALMMMQLEKAGFDTWLDKNRLRVGNDWSQEIDRGITEAFALIVVMSPAAKASEYVTYEWSFALGAGIPVLPVLRERTELHPRLSRLQYIDFTHAQPWDALIAELSDMQKQSSSGIRIPRDTPPHIRHAIAALDSANPTDRKGAIDTLTETQHPVAENALVAALEHPLQDVRFAAALVASSRGDSRAIPPLLERIGPDERYFWEVHDALKRIGRAAVEPLIEALDGDNQDVRRIAVIVLGNLTAHEAVPYLGSVDI